MNELLESLKKANVGDGVRFDKEKQKYTIQARSDRYLVCTKPFNPRLTVLYTIVDLENEVRGTENLVFCMGAETREDCEEMIMRLEGKDPDDPGYPTEISHRNRIALVITAVIPQRPPKRPAFLAQKALSDVAAERDRQVHVEGFTAAHDDQYDGPQLSMAAACYAAFSQAYPAGNPVEYWPWDKSWWKPSTDQRKNLVKAAALLIAEIERIDRKTAKEGGAI